MDIVNRAQRLIRRTQVTGREPYALLIGTLQVGQLLDDPQIVDRMKYGALSQTATTKELVAGALESLVGLKVISHDTIDGLVVVTEHDGPAWAAVYHRTAMRKTRMIADLPTFL